MVTQIRPEAARTHTGEIARGRPYDVTFSDLRPVPGTCPVCHGPSIRLTIAVDPILLGSGFQPPANLEGIGGFKRYFHDNICSGCELRSILRQIFPAAPAPILAPVEAELLGLRAELAARDTPAPPEAAPIPGALFAPGKFTCTPSAAGALWRCRTGTPPSQQLEGQHTSGYPDAMALLVRHVRGDHGLIGRLSDGDPELGSGGNPLASTIDRNSDAVKSGWGSVRSVFQVVRTARDPGRSPYVAERHEIGIRSELAVATTVCGLASEVMGQT